ncbi:hypothetical protein C7999DRAFT_13172 [Corynascus novoguineensis]|uniref:Uncharacterized protein n=1 Tax=Corynascus novoguineensis TaxID=1126955 RepID=A0AAN7HGH2_9PEZI|nr:hypothetical protein C7999DRAFT_13172 [Corynascus novoguineensis]
MLLDMYWHAIHREMAHLIRSLVEWQEHFPSVVLEDEKKSTISGYTTFINQLDEKLRESADIRFDEKRAQAAETRLKNSISYIQSRAVKAQVANDLQGTAWFGPQYPSESLIIVSREGRPRLEIWQRRARMLLQSAGWLDIDKLVEYREPPEDVGLRLKIWNKPRAPQLTMSGLTPDFVPNFIPLGCSFCQATIRGIMFSCARDCEPSPSYKFTVGDVVCEDCFRVKLGPFQHSFVKRYKHCVLDEAITPATARKLCGCLTVRRYDADGNGISLFPVDPAADHRRSALSGTGRCRLFTLGEVLAGVKHRQLQEDIGSTPNERATPALNARRFTLKNHQDRVRPLDNLKSTVEDDIDGGVPLPVRKFLEGFPLGNSHLSLMIGPLIIENGVNRARSGALITCREPPHLQAPIEIDANPLRSIAVSEQRSIFTQPRPFQERRLKACMKQVVSGAFSGFLDESREARIANLLVNEAQTYSELETKFPTRTRAWFERKLEQAAERLVVEAQPLLEPRIRYYLDLVATRIMDPDFRLNWDFMDNNCQKFCDGLLSYNVFGRVFDPYDDSGRAGNEESIPRPLYLMSFVCRPESYTKQYTRTKYDVPNGLTEEYLLKFRYGRHDHADIFDTLQEYWYDLGNFRGPLYKHQELFPWDCTEAYCREPTKCNDCSLSKHVWAFPFDSWSLIHLHLQKDRRWYPPRDVNKLRLTDREWMDNRLQLILAQDVLIQGAISIQKHLKHSCGWLAQSAKFDRLRLGGIHRAQPLSHHYERGRFQEAYVTPWVHLRREEQIRIYESIRDRRIELPDIEYKEPSKSSSDWDSRDSSVEYWQEYRTFPSGLDEAGSGAPWVGPADMEAGGPRDARNETVIHDNAGSGAHDSGWGGWGGDDSGCGGGD